MKKFISITLCMILGFFSGAIIYIFKYYAFNHNCSLQVNKLPCENSDNNNATINYTFIKLSPYTGESLDINEEYEIPFLCVMENSNKLNPRSGLSQADIIYDIYIKNKPPKLLALFHKNSPNKIGPIIPIDYNDFFSKKNNNVDYEFITNILLSNTIEVPRIQDSLDMYYWIDINKEYPNNIFTSAENIRDLINSKNFISFPNPSLKFNSYAWNDDNIGTTNGINLSIQDIHTVSYKFKNQYYEKYINGTLVTDDNNNSPLRFSNILIQIYNNNSNDVNSQISGEGLAFSNGKVKSITWNKSFLSSTTNLFLSDGEPLMLSPGTTLWHIIDDSTTISFE